MILLSIAMNSLLDIVGTEQPSEMHMNSKVTTAKQNQKTTENSKARTKLPDLIKASLLKARLISLNELYEQTSLH